MSQAQHTILDASAKSERRPLQVINEESDSEEEVETVRRRSIKKKQQKTKNEDLEQLIDMEPDVDEEQYFDREKTKKVEIEISDDQSDEKADSQLQGKDNFDGEGQQKNALNSYLQMWGKKLLGDALPNEEEQAKPPDPATQVRPGTSSSKGSELTPVSKTAKRRTKQLDKKKSHGPLG